MKNLNQLIELENRLQEVLLNDDYTLIAPLNNTDFWNYIKLANKSIDGETIHSILSNKNSIKALLGQVSYSGELRIYLMTPMGESIFGHQTIEQYVKHNNINFSI